MAFSLVPPLAQGCHVVYVKGHLSAGVKGIGVSRPCSAVLACVTISLQDLVAQLDRYRRTERSSALRRFQYIFTGLEVMTVFVGADLHPLQVSQLPNSPGILANSGNLPDFLCRDDPADVGFQESPDPIPGACPSYRQLFRSSRSRNVSVVSFRSCNPKSPDRVECFRPFSPALVLPPLTLVMDVSPFRHGPVGHRPVLLSSGSVRLHSRRVLPPGGEGPHFRFVWRFLF